MEKTFQMDNVDVYTIHDRLVGELQNNGFEIHRDEPRDNGFKIFVRRGEEHGEVELFNDWGTVRLITHGALEWELMNIAEPVVNQGTVAPYQRPVQTPPQLTQQQSPPMQYPPTQQPPFPQQPYQPQQQIQRPPMPPQVQPPPQVPQTLQPQVQQPYQPTPQGGSPEHTQLVNVLVQSGYQIEVNTVNGQVFFIRGRKGNYVIDIEGRSQP
ncbi:hypothetical protein [Stygiolobus caldivivus]|uniref:Uncharacterized protein n=1 Tax=Stygiolobus caldivivus TaxID=2824673 RepID=A0A8D5ZHP4_9CREN|nr:hypothetical protein [Stygiolobus caldivivus]BCU69884.1 hypothetical protein KN1_11810 [Stygiolobus caldivivus]